MSVDISNSQFSELLRAPSNAIDNKLFTDKPSGEQLLINIKQQQLLIDELKNLAEKYDIIYTPKFPEIYIEVVTKLREKVDTALSPEQMDYNLASSILADIQCASKNFKIILSSSAFGPEGATRCKVLSQINGITFALFYFSSGVETVLWDLNSNNKIGPKEGRCKHSTAPKQVGDVLYAIFEHGQKNILWNLNADSQAGPINASDCILPEQVGEDVYASFLIDGKWTLWNLKSNTQELKDSGADRVHYPMELGRLVFTVAILENKSTLWNLSTHMQVGPKNAKCCNLVRPQFGDEIYANFLVEGNWMLWNLTNNTEVNGPADGKFGSGPVQVGKSVYVIFKVGDKNILWNINAKVQVGPKEATSCSFPFEEGGNIYAEFVLGEKRILWDINKNSLVNIPYLYTVKRIRDTYHALYTINGNFGILNLNNYKFQNLGPVGTTNCIDLVRAGDKEYAILDVAGERIVWSIDSNSNVGTQKHSKLDYLVETSDTTFVTLEGDEERIIWNLNSDSQLGPLLGFPICNEPVQVGDTNYALYFLEDGADYKSVLWNLTQNTEVRAPEGTSSCDIPMLIFGKEYGEYIINGIKEIIQIKNDQAIRLLPNIEIETILPELGLVILRDLTKNALRQINLTDISI